MRNTHLHEQVGAKKWAIQDSNLTSKNTPSDIGNEQNIELDKQGGAECASLVDQSEKLAQLIAVIQKMSIEDIEQLLRVAIEISNS